MDNKIDQVVRGRTAAGSRNGSAKLDERIIREIRALHAETGRSYKDIGAEFNVTGECISEIVKRKTWKHVDS